MHEQQVVADTPAEEQPKATIKDDPRLFDMAADPLLVASNLLDEFVVPPFSVLDTRQGYWQERARQWLGLGIKSEIGRDDELTFSNSIVGNDAYKGFSTVGTTSVFDPVLCEIVYRWFSQAGGTVLDPFAGGSVRGVLAHALERQYIGIELRGEQVEANRAQAATMFATKPLWITGDSAAVLSEPGIDPVDLVFTCPPYADLEVYSDNPADLSNMDPQKFITTYREILRLAVGHLKQDRFAVLVVGNLRDKNGHLRDLVRLTIAAMRAGGAEFYNEIVLVNAVGTGAVRARRPMNATRKIVKMHQMVLVFVKGDAKRAAEALGPIGKDVD